MLFVIQVIGKTLALKDVTGVIQMIEWLVLAVETVIVNEQGQTIQEWIVSRRGS